MRRIGVLCLVAISFTLLHNLYLFQVQEEEEVEDELVNSPSLSTVALFSQFVATSMRRVKRRIFYSNETLPTMDASIFGNRTGRNHTVSLIKLLNKNYFILKKQYYEMLEKNKSAKFPTQFHGEEYLAKTKLAAGTAPPPANGTAAASSPSSTGGTGSGAPPPPASGNKGGGGASTSAPPPSAPVGDAGSGGAPPTPSPGAAGSGGQVTTPAPGS